MRSTTKSLINLNYSLLKNKIEDLLTINPDLHLFFLYLSTRERSATKTDLYQLSTVVKKFTCNKLNTKDINSFLEILEEGGVGRFEYEDKRPKFIWKYWMMPLLESHSQKCFGIKLISVDFLRADRKQYALIMKKTKNIEKDLTLGIKKESTKIDIVLFEGKKIPGSLSKFSIEELIKEIQDRGFNCNLTPKN